MKPILINWGSLQPTTGSNLVFKSHYVIFQQPPPFTLVKSYLLTEQLYHLRPLKSIWKQISNNLGSSNPSPGSYLFNKKAIMSSMVIGSHLKAYFRNSAAFSRFMGHVSSKNELCQPMSSRSIWKPKFNKCGSLKNQATLSFLAFYLVNKQLLCHLRLLRIIKKRI